METGSKGKGWRMAIETAALIMPLNSPYADLAHAGGKGASLARMALAGLPVPDGFILSTRAYQEFVQASGLAEPIQNVLATSGQDEEQASRQIRELFRAAPLPQVVREALVAAYGGLGEGPVAVRSSATAEDLPEMSFAGQQETYLNVLGSEALCRAVMDCWSSLWTARAIGYRRRNEVTNDEVALAVVVQRMVASETSGVLFTANPLSGKRGETVIDAAYGLGEALVSGQVEPDHYVVDASERKILAKSLGQKAVSLHPQEGGGLQAVNQPRQERQALADEQIMQLAALGYETARLYGQPQDIEWAWAGGAFYLLQSRAITSLYPLPEGLPSQPLKVFFSFAAVQGMLDPLTPLGMDSLKLIFACGAGLFGIRVNADSQQILFSAGERLWVNDTNMVKNSLGRKAVQGAIEFLEPSIGQALGQIWEEPALQPGKPGVSFKARRQLARFFIPIAANVLLNLLFPHLRRRYILENGERVLREMEANAAAIQGDRYQRLAQAVRLLPDLAEQHLRPTLRLFLSGVISGVASWNILNMLAKLIPAAVAPPPQGWQDTFLEVTRGMPYNPTTEMDLALWQISRVVKADLASLALFQTRPPQELSEMYLAEKLPARMQECVSGFLAVYGSRGLGEIDLGRERWGENPLPIFDTLTSYLRMEDNKQAPDTMFARGAQSAARAIEEICAGLRSAQGGWLKSRLARLVAGRARAFLGIRESPKFFAVRMMGVTRRTLLGLGAEFVESGELKEADDFVFLTLSELQAFAAREKRDWAGLIASRRAAYQRELRRKQIPRVLLSDGRAFYEGLKSTGSGDLSGSPVSPGVAEGLVRVVLDPRQANLQPGEILVCPGTDPSWTPLFLSAGGLVMEVGGMMTHGAVVAREYGIPAIVGVDQATSRLRSGQRIRIDGSSGQIDLLDEKS
jgi:rifampicin phosphotransferase